jgi:hypothetical protein
MRFLKCLTDEYSSKICENERLNKSHQYLYHINKNNQNNE